jgi:hypothetical protein
MRGGRAVLCRQAEWASSCESQHLEQCSEGHQAYVYSFIVYLGPHVCKLVVSIGQERLLKKGAVGPLSRLQNIKSSYHKQILINHVPNTSIVLLHPIPGNACSFGRKKKELLGRHVSPNKKKDYSTRAFARIARRIFRLVARSGDSPHTP